jgi:hypothetical protein
MKYFYLLSVEPIFFSDGTTVANPVIIDQGEVCVNLNLSATNKSQIGNEILAYLVDYPKAQDTLEGIVAWWLLERKINYEKARVKDALSELIANGMLLEMKGPDSQIHYRINQSRFKEIKNLVTSRSG